jgi:hypothetical protein
VNVTRNPDGSHEPAYDESWPPRLQLEWSAGVVSAKTGLRIHVSEVGEDQYAVRVGSSGLTPMSLANAYAFLDGVAVGARETSVVSASR